MTTEQKFFLQVLSDHLSQRHTIPVKDLDWSKLYEMSRAHQVEGIVYFQCKDFMPEYSVFENAFYLTLYHYKNRKAAMEEIKTVLSAHIIPFFVVKGLESAQFYPVPALRTMGDTDIVIHEKDKDKVGEILIDAGFTYKLEFMGKEQVYSYHDMLYELHHRLVYDELITIPEQEKFFNNCWKFVKAGKLDASFHFLFLLVHLRKHLMNEGAGFRQFMDIAAVGRNNKELDWPWIEEELKSLKLHRFAQKCCSLIELWFDVSLPIEHPKLDEDFCKRATTMIFDNGIFGLNDKKNEYNGVINRLRKFSGPRWLGRIIILIDRLFPRYRFLCASESYAFLRGRPFLIPAAWVYRFWLMATGRTTGGEKTIKQILLPAKVITLREEDMRQWGLVD